MKVAINKCYGGFGLSDKAVEECIALGMTVSDEKSCEKGDFFIRWSSPLFGQKYYCNRYDKEFRCDPRLIQVIEKLGDEANTTHSKLRIIDIPFENCEGWEISEYDGIEWIDETHRSWE